MTVTCLYHNDRSHEHACYALYKRVPRLFANYCTDRDFGHIGDFPSAQKITNPGVYF